MRIDSNNIFKFIFSYKHSLGTYFNLITTINDNGIVDYEYSYNSNFIYDSDDNIFVKNSLNTELSKRFIEYINKAKIEEMDQEYYREESIIDNAPYCNFVLLNDSDSIYVYVEADSYPKSFKYIIKALDLINSNVTYWYKYMEGEID